MKSNQQAVVLHLSHSVVQVLFFFFGSHLDTNQWWHSLWCLAWVWLCLATLHKWLNWLFFFCCYSFMLQSELSAPKVSPSHFGSCCDSRGLHLAHCMWQHCVFCRTFCTLSYINHLVNATSFSRSQLWPWQPFIGSSSSWVLAPHKQNSCLILQFFPFSCSR